MAATYLLPKWLNSPYLLASFHPVAGLGFAMSLPNEELPVTGFTCRGGLFILRVLPLQAQGLVSAAALLPGSFLGSPFLAVAQAGVCPPRSLLGFPGERGLLQGAIGASRDTVQEPWGLGHPQRAGPPEACVLGHGGLGLAGCRTKSQVALLSQSFFLPLCCMVH